MCNDKNVSLSNPIAKGILAGINSDNRTRILNLSEAFSSLKESGANEEEALSILDSEISLISENEESTTSISPGLFDIFGSQYVSDALTNAYEFMNDYHISWDEYEHALSVLLSAYSPDDIAKDSGLITYYLIRLGAAKSKYIESRDNLESIEDLKQDADKYKFIGSREDFESIEDLENQVLSEMKKRY